MTIFCFHRLGTVDEWIEVSDRTTGALCLLHWSVYHPVRYWRKDWYYNVSKWWKYEPKVDLTIKLAGVVQPVDVSYPTMQQYNSHSGCGARDNNNNLSNYRSDWGCFGLKRICQRRFFVNASRWLILAILLTVAHMNDWWRNGGTNGHKERQGQIIEESVGRGSHLGGVWTACVYSRGIDIGRWRMQSHNQQLTVPDYWPWRALLHCIRH